MKAYQAYLLDRGGLNLSRMDLWEETDDAARCSCAKLLFDGGMAELWTDGRRIDVILPRAATGHAGSSIDRSLRR